MEQMVIINKRLNNNFDVIERFSLDLSKPLILPHRTDTACAAPREKRIVAFGEL